MLCCGVCLLCVCVVVCVWCVGVRWVCVRSEYVWCV